MNASSRPLSRRLALVRGAACVGAATLPGLARAQGAPIKIGLMLPYTGTFAQIGVSIENGFRLALDEQGGKLGGRAVEFVKLDDESEPSKGVENAQKLVQRDKVDVIVGTVHSGVQMGIQKVARDTGVLSIIPNAGVLAATRAHKLMMRRGLEKSMEGDFETDSMRYKATERYALGWTDPRGVFGTAGV